MSHHANSNRIASFERLCREHGLPLTSQRRAILEEVLAHNDHPTADDIYEMVRRRLPDVSRATVYRGLETLVRLGVIARPSHPGSAAHYDSATERHHHLVCIRCHRVTDLEAPLVDELRMPDTRRMGFQIRDYSVHFSGLCAECRQKPAKVARGRGKSPRRSRRRI